MFKGPQEMLLAGNASAAATSAATVADNAKMCASSLIFRAIKWCFSLALGGSAPPLQPPTMGALPHKECCLLTPPAALWTPT